MVQNIHAQVASNFYFPHRNEEWVRDSQVRRIYETENMDVDLFHFGNAAASQVFWRRDIAVNYLGRYFDALERRAPPENSFQDWISCCKS